MRLIQKAVLNARLLHITFDLTKLSEKTRDSIMELVEIIIDPSVGTYDIERALENLEEIFDLR